MTASHGVTLAIIGGSGLYQIDGFEAVSSHRIETPWGRPSDDIVEGQLEGIKVLFLPRHGRGHHIAPSDINYRANIAALKMLGATDLVSLSACGSFREDMAPGHFVLVDQFIDRTKSRPSSFFGSGLVAHVSMAHPVCAGLTGRVRDAAEENGLTVHARGTYLAIEGPQFSSLAESQLYRSWGCDVIGMTAMPEARLAREAELPYALVGMVTDYDCWHAEEEAVSVTNVLEVLSGNAEKARHLVKTLATRLAGPRHPSPDGIETVLDYALVTADDKRDPAMVEKCRVIARRVLG